jgi:hypothetical protein
MIYLLVRRVRVVPPPDSTVRKLPRYGGGMRQKRLSGQQWEEPTTFTRVEILGRFRSRQAALRAALKTPGAQIWETEL